MCHCAWLSLLYSTGAQYQVGYPPFQSDINQEFIQVERGHQEATGIAGLSTCLIRGLDFVPWVGKNLGFWILCWALQGMWMRQVTSSQKGGRRQENGYVCERRSLLVWVLEFPNIAAGKMDPQPLVPTPFPLCSLSCYVLIRKYRRNLATYKKLDINKFFSKQEKKKNLLINPQFTSVKLSFFAFPPEVASGHSI